MLAGTREQHLDRFGRLAETGVDSVVVGLADLGRPDAVEAMGPVVDAFSA